MQNNLINKRGSPEIYIYSVGNIFDFTGIEKNWLYPIDGVEDPLFIDLLPARLALPPPLNPVTPPAATIFSMRIRSKFC